MSIVTTLSKKAVIDKALVKQVYNKILRYNHDALFSGIPDKRVKFTVDDMDSIVRATGLTSQTIKSAIMSSKALNDGGVTTGSPLNTAFALMIFMTSKSDPKFADLTATLMGVRFYSSLHFKFYKTLPNSATMRAAINGMRKNNDIRKYGSVIAFVEHKARGNHANMSGIAYKTGKRKGTDRVARARDIDFSDYIVGLWTRLNNSMRFSIGGNFYDAHEKGIFLNETTDLDTPDWVDNTNVSQVITRHAVQAALGLQTHVDPKMIRHAATMTTVSYATLLVIADVVCRKEYDDVYLCCLNIVGLFLSDRKNNEKMINSRYFEDRCEELYRQNNANDARIKDIKMILDRVLTKHYEAYTELKRDATQSNYKKALFMIFVKAIFSYA